MLSKMALSQQRFLFLLSATLAYSALLVWFDFLQGPIIWDEVHYWETSLIFSDRLIPNIHALKSYDELSTPLPFIIFGGLEYLFHQGIVAGRLLNLLLSLVTVFLIGWPTQNKNRRPLLCFIGFLVCQEYFWYCGRLYTDVIACFWVLLGYIAYSRGRHLLSCAAFILAIASRQYMLAFPTAIALYEFVVIAGRLKTKGVSRRSSIGLAVHWRWIAPAIAALSIFGWFLLFRGLTPATAITVRDAPAVQRSVVALTPGGAINFLAFVGFYLVIPEFILFQPQATLRRIAGQWPLQWRRFLLIAIALLLYTLVFPPLFNSFGVVRSIVRLLHYDGFKITAFYSLALLACIRLSKPSLLSFMVLFNTLIMMKAYPWDKYIAPLAVVFWYMKSVGLER